MLACQSVCDNNIGPFEDLHHSLSLLFGGSYRDGGNGNGFYIDEWLVLRLSSLGQSRSGNVAVVG